MNGVIQEYGSFIVEFICALAVVAVIEMVMNGMSDIARFVVGFLVGA